VDTAFIARLGSVSLAALGVGTMVLSGVFWIFSFLSVGSQTEVSQSRGRGDAGRGRRMGSLALALAFAAGSVIGVLAAAGAIPLAALMGASEGVLQQAAVYIRIRAAGAPAVLTTITAFGILYGLQDMRTPLKIALLVNGLNIALDALLIFGLGPLPPMGIAGAAAASVFSQWVGAALGLRCIASRLGLTTRIHIADIKRLLQVGFDMFIRTGLLTLFLLLATRSATRIGPDAGAAHQAIRQVWVFTALFLDASAISAQSLIGYFFGSGRIGDARLVARLVCLWSIVVGGAIMAAMMAGKGVAAMALVPESGRDLFYPAWAAAALIQPVGAITFVTDGIHWGTGDFRYLRNVVILTTCCGFAGLWLLDETRPGALTRIWWIIGGWIFIRAALGVFRIWPGTAASPLNASGLRARETGSEAHR
jgi:MATE family multidrug resistance protein